MINELNIKIFDYIYSTNVGLLGSYLENRNTNDLCNNLSGIIGGICDEYDFWNEYKHLFNDNCVIDASTLDSRQYIYDGFPKLRLNTKKEYFSYKVSQIKESISNNCDFIQEEFEKLTDNIINEGKKEILDYCEEIGIIEYTGKVFISADNSPACAIIYDNIKSVVYTQEEYNNLVANNVIIVSGSGNTFNSIEQNNESKNNDNELFELVLKKLELLEHEGVSKEQLTMLENACREKDKSKVASFLKDVATGTISSLIAAGILAKFGIQ